MCIHSVCTLIFLILLDLLSVSYCLFCNFETLWFFVTGLGCRFFTLPSPCTCMCQTNTIIGKYQNYITSVSLT